MSRATLPLHARNHMCGGSDPIPGICDLLSVPAAGDYEAIVRAIGDLRGYWRLGESAAPFADTSGYDVTNPADLTRHTNGVAMTLDATGALAATYDDGCIVQNYAGTTSSGNTNADWLEWLLPDDRFNFDIAGVTDEMSCAAWIKPLASANTWIGGIIANKGDSGGADVGWALYMSWPSRTLTFWRGGISGGAQSASTAGGLTAGEWFHAAATYDGADIRLYVNGVLADTVPSAADLPALSFPLVGNMAPALGSYRGRFYGSMDEAAVWSKALTAEQVASLAAADSGAGSVAAAGYVPTSDGAGGTVWAAPTITVNY